MLKSRYLGALVVACVVVSSAIGQDADDKKAQRRERLKELAEIGVGIAAEAAASEGDTVSGNVITLQGKRGSGQEVNVGGLVVVRIPDSGSRPPQDIAVEHREHFERIGQVRGVAMQKGKQGPGGGFTWILLKPTTEGKGVIIVSVTQHDGSNVETEYTVLVTSVEKTTEATDVDVTEADDVDVDVDVEEVGDAATSDDSK